MNAHVAILAFGPLVVAALAAAFTLSRVRAFNREYGSPPTP